MDVPLLRGTLVSNDLTVDEVVDRITIKGGLGVALLGLSFKASSDDLRESPNVQLAETLLGKGYHVKIHDPVVKPSRLIGRTSSSWSQSCPTSSDSCPILRSRRSTGPTWRWCARQILLSSMCRWRGHQGEFDLNGQLEAVEALHSYEGMGW